MIRAGYLQRRIYKTKLNDVCILVYKEGSVWLLWSMRSHLGSISSWKSIQAVAAGFSLQGYRRLCESCHTLNNSVLLMNDHHHQQIKIPSVNLQLLLCPL